MSYSVTFFSDSLSRELLGVVEQVLVLLLYVVVFIHDLSTSLEAVVYASSRESRHLGETISATPNTFLTSLLASKCFLMRKIVCWSSSAE